MSTTAGAVMTVEAINILQQQIQRQLQSLLQRNAAGGDIAPGERMRLEGWMEAVLLLAAAQATQHPPQFVTEWQQQLPAHAQLQCQDVEGRWQVRLDVWQARAPVTPSTRT